MKMQYLMQGTSSSARALCFGDVITVLELSQTFPGRLGLRAVRTEQI